MNKISAIILAKNEEKKIEQAVKSLTFCDEILVINDDSTDETKTIAENTGAKVFTHSKKNEFSGQRNWAMEQAKNDWVLFIDADEKVSEDLKFEIKHLKLTDGPESYAIPRRDFFWNTELAYGETRKARTKGIVRLVKKGSGVWIGAVHETFVATGESGKLHSFLDHYSHDTLSEFIEDINIYSSIRAQELALQGKEVSAIELIVFPFGKFVYTYFILGGFLDGAAGFVYSFVMSFHSFLVRAKLITQSYV
jgi:glycosyltransferase involved in cell wall biosynthesis